MPEILELPAYNLSSEWIAAILLIVVLCLLWIKINYSRRFQLLFGALVNNRFLKQLMREELVFSHRASIVLTLVFFLVGSLFLFELDSIFQFNIIDAQGFNLWGSYLILLTMIYVIKVSSMQLIKLISGADYGLEEYQYNIFLINNAVGVILLPFVCFGAYFYREEAGPLLLIGIIIVTISLLYRLGRGVFSAIENRIPLFYIILYLCSLEILPLLILFKAVKG